MLKKFREEAEKYNLIKRADRITLGLSGGADSVCLLLMLVSLREELDLRLRAVHVHHGLRGAEAEADAEFCKALCERLEVPFALYRIDAAALAREHHISEEEAGRNARYEILRAEAGGGLIAVAHHRDDQCETVLHNIIRGTGIRGLAGMERKNGSVIRPLLSFSREEIEDFLEARGQNYCTDSTNEENGYTRNKLRNLLIPYIEENINPGFREHLISLSEQAAEMVKDPAAAAEKLRLKEAMEELAGTKRDIAAVHVNSAYALSEKPVGSRVSLPYGMEAVKTYDGVTVEKIAEKEPAPPLPEL